MANARSLSWSTALRELRDDRLRPQGVREERLRATAGLRGQATLSSWRGRSGRRYVVGVGPLSLHDLADIVEDAVVIAVRRNGAGVAAVVDAAMVGALPKERRMREAWVAAVKAHGATEMHVHRLAADATERLALIDDLRDDPTPVP